MMDSYVTQIVALAMRHRLPTTSIFAHFTQAGLLMSYGPNLNSLFQQAAIYVDRVLKGAKPEDLPVQRPTRFELVVNLKTDKTLGLAIPPSLLVQADLLIE
jgi:putative ABC transport system substrate-binding protein